MSALRKAKPYKRIVTRKGKAFCPCRHCDKGGWDAYMLQGDLWKMVLPPDVRPNYTAGFVCLRCALESIDRPLCREDITGGMEDTFPSLGDPMGADGFWFEIRFPKRDAKRKAHAIHLQDWPDGLEDPIGKIESEFGWLLDRLSLQANKVIVGVDYHDEKPFTIGSIAL